MGFKHHTLVIPFLQWTLAEDDWRVVVTPNDGNIDGISQEVNIVVSNTSPSVSNIAIVLPTGVYNDNIVNCSATVF